MRSIRVVVDSCGAEPLKFALNVADLVGDVMHPRPAALKKAADGSVRTERLEQLDVVLTEVEQDGLNALLLNDFAVHELDLERCFVEL